MPAQNVLLYLKAKAPTLSGVFLLLAMCTSIGLQSSALLRLVSSSEVSPASNSPPLIALAPQHSTYELFGLHVPIESEPPPATDLQLTLLGSFVNSEPLRSSALILSDNNLEQHFTVGEEVDAGVLLKAVHVDHVELLRNGRRESLAFSEAKINYNANNIPPEKSKGSDEKSHQSQQSDMQLLHARTQTLREKIEYTNVQERLTASDELRESD